jgi:flagellar basal-body rod modification protein FlgD
MSINATATLNQLQNNTNQINYQNSRANLGTGKLDRQGFVQLILAQLQYQDPTNPQDNSQMLAQQLQLQQSDDSTAVVNATKFSQAASMVGKQATLTDARWDFTHSVTGNPELDPTTGKPASISGPIQSVQFDSAHNKALVKINDHYYEADKIRELSLPLPATTLNPTSSSTTTTNAAGS